MRLLAAGAASFVAGVLVGCGEHRAEPTVAASCPLVVQFGRVQYLGTTVKQTLRLGRRLGRAFAEPCSDAILAPSAPDAPSGGAVAAIIGIPPAVAVGVPGQPHTAYLGFGYFPELANHPLYGGRVRDFTRGCRVTGRFALVGRVKRHGSALLVQVDRSSGTLVVRPHVTLVQLLVDAHTRVEGFERNGLPYVTIGDRLRASGITCQFQGPQSPAIVARTIIPNRVDPAPRLDSP
jgi:hypothetical protein